MPWNNNSGGSGGGGNPWGGGSGGGGSGGGGPWGGGNRPSGGGRGPRPPDFEAILRRGQDRLKNLMPGGFRSGRGIAIAAFVLVAIWLATGLYRVQTNEQALKLVFGKYSDKTGEGLTWNWPAPIGAVEIVKFNLTRIVEIGNSESAARGSNVPRRSRNAQLMLTGDENIVDVRFTVFWDVKDPIAFRFKIRNPEESIRAAAESAMREVIGKTDMLLAMTQGRRQVEEATRTLLQQILDDYQSGVKVTEITLQRIDPPTPQVNAAFVDVQTARADKESLINQAIAYRNEILPKAKGSASRIVQQGEAYRAEIVNRAQGDAQRFIAVYTQYTLAKDITARRLMIETMEEVLRNTNKVLIDKSAMGGGVLPYLPLPEIKKQAAPAPGADQGAGK